MARIFDNGLPGGTGSYNGYYYDHSQTKPSKPKPTNNKPVSKPTYTQTQTSQPKNEPINTEPQRDYYDEIMSYYRAQQNRARNSAINSLRASLNNGLTAYDNQLASLGDEYQKLRNQSEVERYKAKGAMREALANRGQLDSGLGRQETLNMQTKFGNAINNINLQEQKARQEIESAKNALRAQYEAQVAQLDSMYANNFLSDLSGLFAS